MLSRSQHMCRLVATADGLIKSACVDTENEEQLGFYHDTQASLQHQVRRPYHITNHQMPHISSHSSVINPH